MTAFFVGTFLWLVLAIECAVVYVLQSIKKEYRDEGRNHRA